MPRPRSTSSLRLIALASCAAFALACKGGAPGETTDPRLVEKLVATPVPPELVTAAGAAQLGSALSAIKEALPSATAVMLDFPVESTELDWLPVLDTVGRAGMKAVVGFVSLEADGPRPFRPVSYNSEWILGPLQPFIEDARFTGHAALAAVRIASEPFDGSQGLVFTPDELKALYEHLRGIAPPKHVPPLLVDMGDGFARKPGAAGIEWTRGLADIVVIGQTPFMNSAYAQSELKVSQMEARRQLSRHSPEVAIWVRAQVHGDRVAGIGVGPYFPTAEELTQLFDDLFASELEATAPVSAVVFDRWDALTVARRGPEVVLGDAVRPGEDPAQAEAATAALTAIQAWAEGPEEEGEPDAEEESEGDTTGDETEGDTTEDETEGEDS